MIAIFSGLAGRIFGAVFASPLLTGALVATLFVVWIGLVNNPRVAREARADLVAREEVLAEKARADELQRQVTEGDAAVARLEKMLADMDAAQARQDADREKEIAAYIAEIGALKEPALTEKDKQFLERGKKK